eukprot:CAMPEP_0206442818 /NCGR_PEP_ID=MMETSP0324_2-20121206/14029_1 /ASSEMBLY_ACC=CAM_ASM_000836 /TAXON_ID=2866 /ORGANISM="Crypthecodinium cohnii, Strain Seligo" /LENGTH=515 /DNA_ID=CAMNT_0053910695 /DNA_START=81 /DNA_END=1628 /DNA_ORIENTATION=-
MAGYSYAWVYMHKGDALPTTAVLAGDSATDGPNYVCRVNGEAGKVNLHDRRLHNFWCHKNGKSEAGEVLCVNPGFEPQWMFTRRGTAIPPNAVLAGQTSSDGDNFVGRLKGEAGKVNLDHGKVWNYWVHSNWTGSPEGDLLLIQQSHSGGGGPGWAPAMPSPVPAPSAPPMPHPHYPQPSHHHPSGRWNPSVNCDGVPAGDRARWLMENKSLSDIAAQNQVMAEFPQAFAHHQPPPQPHYQPPYYGHGAGRWNPSVNCDGVTAGDRAKWLMENKSLSDIAAQNQVMAEFPSAFQNAGGHSGGGYGGGAGGWNDGAMCDGSRAADRAQWLVENKRMSLHAAREQIMREFPHVFNDWWNPSANCDGLPAGDRARWLMDNEGYSEHAARLKVKSEFHHQLHGPGHFVGHGKFPHALSIVNTSEGPRLKIEVVCNAPDVRLVAVHYHINGGQPMNFDIRHPEHGSKTYSHVTPHGGGYPLCHPGDQVTYWLAADIKGYLTEEPPHAGSNHHARLHWTAM